MTTRFHVAAAPCSWGVNFADSPDNPPWERVLDEASVAGFTAIDLGPVGYFPTDASHLADELAKRNLNISAGGLFDPLTVEAAFPAIVDKTRRTCEVLKAQKAPRLVIIDDISETRGRTAGRSWAAVRLDRDQWALMMRRIRELARVARDEYGVSSFLHPHTGGYIEFEDEIDAAMNDLPADIVGLCIDTGHTAYAGMDPIQLIRRYSSRIGHMHLKNVDASVLAACLADSTDFFSAVSRGVFSLLADGTVKFEKVRDALDAFEYSGYAVVEQDMDPTGKTSALLNAKANADYLASLGLMTRSAGR